MRGGLAGTALVALDLAATHDDSDLQARGLAIAERLAGAGEHGPGPTAAGFLDGWSGICLLHVLAFERTGDPVWLDRAGTALRRDLARCRTTGDGTLEAEDPGHPRTLPYLARGSAGVALAALALARHDPGHAGVAALPGLLAACRTGFVVHPGLGLGAAGLLLTLAGAPPDPATTRVMDELTALVGRLAAPAGPGIAVGGHQLLRLSTDVDTGNAGVLLALAARGGHPSILPLPGHAHRSPTAGAGPLTSTGSGRGTH
ncbi:hypothetical protein [Pseudonocardia sp. HH130630-07]|uniref:hypothetical protein n=1 Tax=Pseudonocardia sp. HH130630-07 TaxID=1690815 RepID=UPI0008150E39|nr:hypothetical protein [Pseudonocardia sp. HH130630-07]ANY09413.1 hypothetical protein AFB00_27795 [Pseudonocardia sp. HH130630-07]